MLVLGVYPDEILSAGFCVICSFLFVVDASGDHIDETYCSMGLVICFYVTIIDSFCFPHIVLMSILSICSVMGVVLLRYLDAFVCEIRVNNES